METLNCLIVVQESWSKKKVRVCFCWVLFYNSVCWL